MRKYERFFIGLGILTTMVLAATAFWLWLKHSLAIVMDDLADIFGAAESDAVEPEVVESTYDDTDEDDWQE